MISITRVYQYIYIYIVVVVVVVVIYIISFRWQLCFLPWQELNAEHSEEEMSLPREREREGEIHLFLQNIHFLGNDSTCLNFDHASS